MQIEADHRRPTSARSAARSTARRRWPVDPAALAARPHRPLRPGRGGRADRRLRPGAVGAARRRRRAWADPGAAAAPPDRPHRLPGRLRRGGQLPVRRDGDLRRARAARGRRAASRRPAGQPAVTEEPAYTTTLLPGLLKAAARNLGRGAPGLALFETGTVAFPTDRGPDPAASTGGPPRRSWSKLYDAVPEQPLYLAAVLAGERRAKRLVGSGPGSRLGRRDRAGARAGP